MQNFFTFFHDPLFIWSLIVAGSILFIGAFFKIAYVSPSAKNKAHLSAWNGKTGKKSRKKKRRIFSITVDYLIESVYDFFSDILWERAPFRIKSYITNLFLIILLANLLGLILDILISPFPFLGEYIQNPTGDISFTLALAICSMGIILVVEAKTKGLFRFLYSYFPLGGTNLFNLSKPSSLISYLLWFPIKVFDIVISLFIGILNIIGTFAKVVSLAFRLYGNIMAGSLLLSIMLLMIGQMTKSWLAWWELPLLVPLIFYLQSALTTVVQAFVFSLLTSVFIKMSLEEGIKEKKNLTKSPVRQQLVKSMQ